MINQKKLIDGIKSFSPSKEKWISKPPENLPDKVSVTLSDGQTGILDMKDPKAVVWAEIIAGLEQENKPVYLEVDEESNIVTNLLIPMVFKVVEMEPDEHGNIIFQLNPSCAFHGLLKSDPNFESMRASLEEALNDGTELLITETRDEHEIIDVRKPKEDSGGPPEPAPAVPDDPPITEARSIEVFNNMNNESCVPCNPDSDCITFMYPDNGCWIRAHIMCHLMRNGGPNTTTNPPEDPEKVWIRHSPGNSLKPFAPNHPDCHIPFGGWAWHVAPILNTILTGGNEKLVFDPSLCSIPVTQAYWKSIQNDPGATLTETQWTAYNYETDTTNVSLSAARSYMNTYRNYLRTRCLDFGTPPYSCNKRCFFIIDRNTFSDDEINAMLAVNNPAVIEAAFYIVLDGYSPYDLGFTAATMQHTPTLNVSPSVSGMTITADHMVFEYPSNLNRRQRLTWVYKISFTNANGFTSSQRVITLDASISGDKAVGYLLLLQQPAPYENDGSTSWLSTDLRVFQIKTGESKFGETMGSNPNNFITQVITRLNNNNTGGQTFENDISTDQQTSRLEISQTVGGTAVYNFAIAKVRYRSTALPASNVRVFFRLFPVATTSLVYEQVYAYRQHQSGTTIVPLLGIKSNEVTSIPCFASPRINTATTSMTAQTDTPNVQTIPANSGGTEVVRYFGCWLDINQTQPQFPLNPSPVDGPYSSGRISILDHIRNEHQCLVSEIVFTPAPAPYGYTPSTSDKLAQRNLAIVESSNPGTVHSRRIPQTFEIRPQTSKVDNDELMIDWGNIPEDSIATLYLPGFDSNQIIALAASKYRSHRLRRIDEHTIRLATGGITYLPIPFSDEKFPGMLTIDLPEGVKKGEVYKVVVRQITCEKPATDISHRINKQYSGLRHITGSFQLTIPVRDKVDILTGQERLLSNLRWIGQAIPAKSSWSLVFSKYTTHIADRVDSLGGNSSKIYASPTGQWQEARRRCRLFATVITIIISLFAVAFGTLSVGLMTTIDGIGILLLIWLLIMWNKKCRPKSCKIILTVLTGLGVASVILAILKILGFSGLRLDSTLFSCVGITVILGIIAWIKGCFRR